MNKYQPREISELKDFGRIKVKLNEMLKKRDMTKNRLQVLAQTSFGVVQRYCTKEDMHHVDTDFLSKCCYILDCQIADLLEYIPPKMQ